MELPRKQVIELLEKHHMWTGEPQEVVDVRLENAALDYAINSLKTDEAYQIMYEGGEIFTKADMVAMLKDLRLDIEAKENYYEQAFKEPSNAVHESAMCGRMFGCGECKDIIQQKINALKGEQGENTN